MSNGAVEWGDRRAGNARDDDIECRMGRSTGGKRSRFDLSGLGQSAPDPGVLSLGVRLARFGQWRRQLLGQGADQLLKRLRTWLNSFSVRRATALILDTAIVEGTCTPTFYPTSPRHWRVRSASRRPPISIPSAFPSMFEPIHGSAFDIMGKGVANPVGTFWSAVMMLEHLGEKAAGDRLMKAIERVTADDRFHTPDLGGKAKTSDVTAAVIDAIHGANA